MVMVVVVVVVVVLIVVLVIATVVVVVVVIPPSLSVSSMPVLLAEIFYRTFFSRLVCMVCFGLV